MITLAALLKLIHVLSGATLFGTGMGIAFFMVWANRTRKPVVVAEVGRMVVIADMMFTATAVVLQPLTGLALVRLQGYGLTEPWLLAAYALYLLTGACWLPVVWIQQRLARMASLAAEAGQPLPVEYDHLYRIWFALGWPAFAAVVGIYWLMLTKPNF
jgi:uncharacterized membrane protein